MYRPILYRMYERSLAKQFGVVIRRLRQEVDLSQEAFADICGVHRTYVGMVERGERTVTIESADKFAKALGLSLSQLFLHLETYQDSQHGET